MDNQRIQLLISIPTFCFVIPSTGMLERSEDSFNKALLENGLRLSKDHSKHFSTVLRRQFFNYEESRKGFVKGKRRKKRALWGLDKFFTDAKKAKDHFGGLTDRIGGMFGSIDTKVTISSR